MKGRDCFEGYDQKGIILMLFPFLRKKKKNETPDGTMLNQESVKKLDITASALRVADYGKDELIFDPVGYDDWIWYSKTNKNELKDLVLKKYNTDNPVLYNMPKSSHTFRPIAYLLPSDSIIYQALVDKLIEYKKEKFSKYVYSDIILDVHRKPAFHKPVLHWIEMRSSIRKCVRKGNHFYFTADIAGYFENIKISKLCEFLNFFTGRNEISYISILEKILKKWQFADSQGIIQPHPASSILGKIYLANIDSEFAYLKEKYHRYVDEFHILADSKKAILQASLKLSTKLREIGLMLNSSKCKMLVGESDIISEISENSDFFESVDYYIRIKNDYAIANDILEKMLRELQGDYVSGKSINWKVFRRCIREFTRQKNPCAIEFCLSIIDKNYEQIVDICKYLAVFVNIDTYQFVINHIQDYLKVPARNLYKWVQVWFLELLYLVDDSNKIDVELINEIMQVSNDELSRSICYLILTKLFNDHDLINYIDLIKNEKSVIVKRALLHCASKLPKTVQINILKIEDDDPIDIIVAKRYLQYNEYKLDNNVLI